jgi:transposase
VEALLEAASRPEPPPLSELVSPELLDQVPEDLSELLALLPRADLYLQDEVQFDLHPTLTRVWCRRGREGQRRVQTPGDNEKFHGFGIADWRDGWFHDLIADRRAAAPFCDQMKAVVARSQERDRVAIVIVDNARIHTPEGSLLVRQLLQEHQGRLHIVYTPAYDSRSNRIEWLWKVSRRAVTHNHRRTELKHLRQDAQDHFRTLRDNPIDVLRHIGSPCAPAQV